MKNKTYITGVGIITSSGVGVDAFCRDLFSDESTQIRLGFISKERCYPYAPLPNEFDRDNDNTIDIVLDSCMNELINSSELTNEELCSPKTALILGATTGKQARWVPKENEKLFQEGVDITKLCENTISESFALRWGMKGMRMAINTACASSACAVGLACELLCTGVIERAIVGSVEVVNWFDVNGFRSSHLLAKEACRPFDKRREGLILGEGGALVLIEKENSRKKKLAEIAGWGSNNEKYAIAAPEPTGGRLRDCIQVTLKRSNLKAENIDYVNAHGTGTTLNDESEAIALSHFWKKGSNYALISSTKGLHGHLRGAAGIVELLASVFAIHYGLAPICRGCLDPDVNCSWNCITINPEYRRIDYAMSISRGFGGVNTSIILKKIS